MIQWNIGAGVEPSKLVGEISHFRNTSRVWVAVSMQLLQICGAPFAK